MWEFKVPGIPPSYTHSFKINYNLKQTYLSATAREFKKKVVLFMPIIHLDITPQIKLAMHNRYHSDWFYKNKNIRKKDVQNMNRLLIDAVFSKLGLDDKHLFCVTDEKIQAPENDYTVVRLWVVTNKEQYNMGG